MVIFAWIVYASRAQRDKINQLVMPDPRLTGMTGKDMPFDGKHMFWGGFKTAVRYDTAG